MTSPVQLGRTIEGLPVPPRQFYQLDSLSHPPSFSCFVAAEAGSRESTSRSTPSVATPETASSETRRKASAFPAASTVPAERRTRPLSTLLASICQPACYSRRIRGICWSTTASALPLSRREFQGNRGWFEPRLRVSVKSGSLSRSLVQHMCRTRLGQQKVVGEDGVDAGAKECTHGVFRPDDWRFSRKIE